MPRQPNPRSTASIGGHPIHAMLVPFPIAFFFGTLASDLAFWRTSDPFWFTASEWLLGAGIVMGLLAALAGLTDLFSERLIRNLGIAWLHALGNIIMVLVEAYNFYLRYSTGVPSVLFTGLWLSVIGVVIILFTGWWGGEMVFRDRVGVSENQADRIDVPPRYGTTEEPKGDGLNYPQNKRPPSDVERPWH